MVNKKNGTSYPIEKIPRISIALLLCLLYTNSCLHCAELDGLYQPLLKKNRILCESRFDYFQMEEEGAHGSAAYDKFYATPRILGFVNRLRCAFFPFLDVTLGLRETFPSSYKRFTYSPTGILTSVQKYVINSFEDYMVDVRLRGTSVELYCSLSEKWQNTSWRWSPDPDRPPSYFSYIKTHYEDIEMGARYVSESSPSSGKTGLSMIDRPLMDRGQLNLEMGLRYQNGTLARNGPYYTFRREYTVTHALKPFLTPKAILRYGLCEDLEFTGGISYATPIIYEYDYGITFANGTTQIVAGETVLDNAFYVPCAIRIRAHDVLEAIFSSDFRFITQGINFWRKNVNNTTTPYPSLGLTYFNIQPTVKLSYLYDAKRKIEKDEFSSVSKTLLRKGQLLAEGQYMIDITHLNRFLEGGSQNLFNPYTIFQYPLDYFVAGTEYATFFTGNTSNYEADVSPQNYHRVHVNLTYGVSDNVNIGLGYGIRTASTLHHLTLFDITNRFYRFNTYHYLDPAVDWRITKNSHLFFRAHIVPRYMTYMENNANPEEFRSKTRYLDMSVGVKMLF